MSNRPVNFNDPTGNVEYESTNPQHRKTDPIGDLKKKLEGQYNLTVKGTWALSELENLELALEKTANFVGGTDKLNKAMTNAARSNKWFADQITIDRVAGARWNPKSSDPSAAAWCGNSWNGKCSKNTLLLADDVFSACYQNKSKGCSGPNYTRPSTFSTDEKIQFTIVHELVHMLEDANEKSLKDYGSSDEDMANELAAHIVSGGSISTTFSQSASQYWDLP